MYIQQSKSCIIYKYIQIIESCKGEGKGNIYTFKTCPILLQWTLYQLQHVVKSVESQPVRTIQVFPFKDMYHCCNALHTLGSTVLLVGVLSSLPSSMLVGVDVLTAKVEVAVSIEKEVDVGALLLVLSLLLPLFPLLLSLPLLPLLLSPALLSLSDPSSSWPT